MENQIGGSTGSDGDEKKRAKWKPNIDLQQKMSSIPERLPVEEGESR